MFLGRFGHTIDDKGRLTLPAKYRTDLATGVVVTRGIEKCLSVYPLRKWEEFSSKIATLPITKKDARAFTRFLFANATDCIPDKQGRILIPPYLRRYAALDGDVIIIGANDHLEIWNPTRFRELDAMADENGEAIAEQLSYLGI
ncbi:MAG: division/cell wall cluster transcriptional repressor MraZ [Anaerolineae bacterium]